MKTYKIKMDEAGYPTFHIPLTAFLFLLIMRFERDLAIERLLRHRAHAEPYQAGQRSGLDEEITDLEQQFCASVFTSCWWQETRKGSC